MWSPKGSVGPIFCKVHPSPIHSDARGRCLHWLPALESDPPLAWEVGNEAPLPGRSSPTFSDDASGVVASLKHGCQACV